MPNGQIDFQPEEASQIDFQPEATAPAKTQATHQPTIGPTPKFPSGAWWKQKTYNIAVPTANQLPTAGATAGSIIGATGGTLTGPGDPLAAVGGAGLGGMAGEAAKHALLALLYPSYRPSMAQESKDISKQGVEQAGIQGVSELLPFLAGPLKNASVGQYERALAPTTRVNKALTQKIAPEMIDRGVSGSLPSIGEKAATNAKSLSAPLDRAYADLASKTPTIADAGTQIVSDLDKLKSRYIVNGKIANPQAFSAIGVVQDVVKQQGKDIDPESLRKLKAVFDDPVASKGGYAGADMTTKYALRAQKVAANSIRSILGKASPDIAALNKEVNFWLNVQKVVGATVERQAGQSGGLTKVLSPLGIGVSGALGLAHGGSQASLEAMGLTSAMALTAQIVRSPAWRTMSAVAKDRLASSLASGSFGEVVALASRLGIAATEKNPVDSQTNLPTNPQQ